MTFKLSPKAKHRTCTFVAHSLVEFLFLFLSSGVAKASVLLIQKMGNGSGSETSPATSQPDLGAPLKPLGASERVKIFNKNDEKPPSLPVE